MAGIEQQSMPSDRAIAYLRVSSAGQAKDGRDGLPRQREAIEAFCLASRAILLEEHSDAGVSGTKALGDRPGLSAALQRAVELNATMLIVEKADRLARDLIEGELILREFRRVGVKVVEAEGGTDLTDGDANPTAKLIRQVIGAVAEFEKSALVAKLRAARDRKRKNGGHPCGAYKFGRHPERPEEAETLSRIHELRRKRAGRKPATLREVAAVLNAESRASRSGREWTATMLRDVMGS
ncbi:MAG TPA: recombinase family protein [Planctomycetota bacterium]|nr:recombinase family protein [Planctomycetota bacterium]